MKEVLRYVFDRKRAYNRLPLFEWMRDERLTPRQRLAFYPSMAHFIMSFGDLNKFVLREQRPGDVFQDMVNAHTAEDDHHWPWYLEDFTKLGFDEEMRGTDWMNFLWGEETQQNRILLARLTSLIKTTNSLERLVVIEAIEETGNVLFSTMLPLAVAVEKEIGQELRYCGPFHFELESGHAVGADHRALVSVKLDENARARCRWMIDEVYTAFEGWTHELLRYAHAHPLRAEQAQPEGFTSATFRIGAKVDDLNEAEDERKLG
ncbi:MAG TPA: hypothetical protein VHM25_24670 [Polyangiaceae bacterium]|nr:hypothetical protein [Polyangiaceae bacterium]